jgi:hypothetical protein
MHRWIHCFMMSAVIAACDPPTEPLVVDEDIDLSLPLSARANDDLIALEWSVAGSIEGRLGREVFVAIGDPPRPVEKFRLPEYEEQESEIIQCEDDSDGATCTCFGVTSCKSDRWASVCAAGTEDCGLFSCRCEWKQPQK